MIETETVDGIRIVKLSHGKASALDLELVVALRQTIETAVAESARAVVLTGSGRIFCAGVDLFRIANGDAAYARRYLAAFRDLMFVLFEAPLPMVAAANGHAIAGGAVLVAACDHRLMAEDDGRFGYTELLVGVPFPPQALEMIRFATPRGLEGMLYAGTTFGVEEAAARGLIDAAVPPDQLMPRALDSARRLADIPPQAFALTKRQLRDATLRRMRECDRTFDAEVVAVWAAAAARARIGAYLERTVRRR